MPTQTKVKCANPFCDATPETECAGEELCAFCEAEERTIIHNYKDESGPDEAPVNAIRTGKLVPCEICGGSGQYGGFCQCCQGSGHQVEYPVPSPKGAKDDGPGPMDEEWEQYQRDREEEAEAA